MSAFAGYTAVCTTADPAVTPALVTCAKFFQICFLPTSPFRHCDAYHYCSFEPRAMSTGYDEKENIEGSPVMELTNQKQLNAARAMNQMMPSVTTHTCSSEVSRANQACQRNTTHTNSSALGTVWQWNPV